jgi:hypothetical protein
MRFLPQGIFVGVTAPLQLFMIRTGLATVVTEPFSCKLTSQHQPSIAKASNKHNTSRHVVVFPSLHGKIQTATKSFTPTVTNRPLSWFSGDN